MRKPKKTINFSLSSYTREVSYQIFQIVKSYLLKLYMEPKETEFELEDLFSYISPGIFSLPSVIGLDLLENFVSNDTALLAVICYKGQRYFFSASMVQQFREGYIFRFNITGENPEELYSAELCSILIREAIRNSGYHGKFLRLYNDNGKLTFKILPTPELTLEDIYLKDKSDLYDFVEDVKRKDQGLRYLFVGEPGTGKTDTIKTIISECLKLNNVTIIEVDSSCGLPLTKIFEYAEIFSPVLLCIDDIDLLVGTRDRLANSFQLSSALQALDGFLSKEENFLIATTNDRSLVDTALRRPGRFDLILEFKELDPEFYSALVLRESKDEHLSEIFKDEQIKDKLVNLKVTGAFIVTLVRHLLKPRYENSKYEQETILNLIDKLYKSFKAEIKPVENIGFGI